jgi:hypothetical protein
LLLLVLVLGLGMALLGWFVAEDARQAALHDARYRQNKARLERARARLSQACRHDGLTPLQRWRLCEQTPGLATDDPDESAAVKETRQAQLELRQASEEENSLYQECCRRYQRQYWPAHLRQEVRRRTGW